MRIRTVLALMVAGILMAAGVASAQDTTTEPLSDYTSTTPTATTPAPSAVAPDSAEEVAPTVAAQPAGNAPSELAFTGAEPLLLIALGLTLAGGATMLIVRDRRRHNGR